MLYVWCYCSVMCHIPGLIIVCLRFCIILNIKIFSLSFIVIGIGIVTGKETSEIHITISTGGFPVKQALPKAFPYHDVYMKQSSLCCAEQGPHSRDITFPFDLMTYWQSDFHSLSKIISIKKFQIPAWWIYKCSSYVTVYLNSNKMNVAPLFRDIHLCFINYLLTITKWDSAFVLIWKGIHRS